MATRDFRATDVGRAFGPERNGRGRRNGGTGGGPLWLITFVDLVSLLLAFFVMMFSMTSPKAPEWEAFTASLRSAFLNRPVSRAADAELPKTADSEDPGRGFDIGYIGRLLETAMRREPVLRDATVRAVGGTLVLSMPTDVFFASGGATMQPAGDTALFVLAEALSNLDNRIDIVGHTDPRPITEAGGRFRSNWELSLARALAVSESLKRSGYRKPIEVRGLADGKFSEIDGTLPLEQRQRMARRVDLVIHQERDRR